MTNNPYVKVTEDEHPARQHHDDLDRCVKLLQDAVDEFVTDEVLTPGEFVSCVRNALSDSIRYHQDRLQLLKDAESLLTNNPKDPQLLNE